MNYKITKLDRRHNGCAWYKYSVSPNTKDLIHSAELLNQARNWMWATYGPSAEIGRTTKYLVWAWDTEHGNRRIYLKSDEELTLFTLKFSG
jgi:hypothetical protein